MRFDRGRTSTEGAAAATAAEVELSASTRASATRPERLHRRGSLRIEQATAINRSVAPSKFVTDPSPLWSQLPSTEPSHLVVCSQSTELMFSSPPILPSAADQAARMVASKPSVYVRGPYAARIHCSRKLHPATTFFMSESFVHRSNIAGCRRFASHLPSGPHEEGCHAE
jgi:hypothetical protein